MKRKKIVSAKVNHQQILMTKTARGTETGLTKRLFEIQTGVAETLRSRSR
jgi:hypothetical protein